MLIAVPLTKIAVLLLATFGFWCIGLEVHWYRNGGNVSDDAKGGLIARRWAIGGGSLVLALILTFWK